MKPGKWAAIIAFSLILIVAVIPACATPRQTPLASVESYVALVPKVLHVGEQGSVSLSLLDKGAPASGSVQVALLQDGRQVTSTSQVIRGQGQVGFTVPNLEPGEYQLQVSGPGFQDKAQVTVERSSLLFLETDKPIYKPGQTIQIRVLSLNSDLRPVSRSIIIEAQDAKGIKVFRQEAATDEFGMASLELPLSTEPNLGVWKLKAAAGDQNASLDVRVEKYVLPKYEVSVQLPKEWFLVSETISGSVKAEYSFGRPVSGELNIKATKYVGQWQEFANITKSIVDGQADFQLPAVSYVAGTPAGGGNGNVMLEVTVEEKATGYKETTTRLLTVASSSLTMQIIPEGPIFKPTLPFSFLVITETPDNQPRDASVSLNITYISKDFKTTKTEKRQVNTTHGKALVQITPPADSAALIIEATSGNSSTSKSLEAGYSPSGNFIHVEPADSILWGIGDEARFKVYSTSEARHFYYEVVSRGRIVFSDFTDSPEIALTVTPQMAPSARLLVYQVLPNSEVAADWVPFDVEARYPQSVTAQFSQEEVGPGDDLEINLQAEGEARIGLAAVDKSVFILAENRLNLQQVFAELERLYMEPQVEIHAVSPYEGITTRGAEETFADAGFTVLTNKTVPNGEEYKIEPQFRWGGGVVADGKAVLQAAEGAVPPTTTTATTGHNPVPSSTGLAEVQRIRQYFPETWIWQEITTDPQGKATVKVTAPDSITTWMLRAVALSRENGLGVAEAQLRVFQPFFLTVDLPYSTIRGEEFPVKVSIYNYLNQEQSVQVELKAGGWFDLLDESAKTVVIAPNDIGSAQFTIRPRQLGVQEIEISARSQAAADAAIKKIIVEPEGVAREIVENLILAAGVSRTVNTGIPQDAVADSGRAFIAITGSYLTQTIEGLEGLLQMPFGCGEQNMILFAPDVFITRYLKETGQIKPEIMAKAELLMITGYQRELTYRRSDGSFSAFGDNDKQGSLWLTAFVLKSFSQGKDIIYIDNSVLEQATAWITSQQKSDGSFEAVGFVHHQEMMGGVGGKASLTAYVAIALLEAGEKSASARAIDYLEAQLEGIDDPYTMAIVAYALELAGSEFRDAAYEKLMGMSIEDENGLHWGNPIEPLQQEKSGGIRPMTMMPIVVNSAQVENTGYAALALMEHGDRFNASRAARWLTSQRNPQGGFGSTQDTVVALQALTRYAGDARADVDLTVSLKAPGLAQELKVNAGNFDVLQVVEVPLNADLTLEASGKGEAIAQLVRRYSLPQTPEGEQSFQVKVDYDTTQVEVNDLVNVTARIAYNPPLPLTAEMVVLDISVPTGFSPVTESIDALLKQGAKIKRYDIAGRKVIFYLEDIVPGEEITFGFQVRAMYPVKAQATVTQAYSYYKPELRGESLGQEMMITEAR